jgi:hypothetical protein
MLDTDSCQGDCGKKKIIGPLEARGKHTNWRIVLLDQLDHDVPIEMLHEWQYRQH